ncbi:MAG: PD-(D/E)XK nuclease family protein [Rhodobacter sp.]|nr:PD-(D/E)XK nuclease family protein [Rhodobacter sp.]
MLEPRDLVKAIDHGIDLRERQEWPLYQGGILDRSAYVTASEIGTCARKIKLDKQFMKETGYDPNEGTKTKSSDAWGFWERGHNVERWIVDHLTRGWASNEWELKYLGEEQVSFTDGVQSGTPDGIAINHADEAFYTLEFKSMDPRTNVSRLPKITHRDQVVQNTDLIAHNMDLSPAGGLILYVDASDHKRRFPHMIEYTDDHAARLQDRAEMIMSTEPEDLKPEGLFSPNNDCQYCKHTAACNMMVAHAKNGKDFGHDLNATANGVFG